MHALLISLLLLATPALAEDSHPEWVHWARDLIGETDIKRAEALKKLNAKFTKAEDIAKELKGEYRPYALDAMVAMRLPGSVDRLIKDLGDDRDGATTLAVNALLDNENHKKIADDYSARLQNSLTDLATPVIVAMVDLLTHLRRPCSDTVCTALLTHPRLEVQQAGALHLAIVPKENRQQILKDNLNGLFPQVRAQVMLTFLAENKKAAAEICQHDQDPIVQSACPNAAPTPAPIKKPIQKKRKGKK